MKFLIIIFSVLFSFQILAQRQAIKASDFMGRIGINTHFGYDNTPYTSQYDLMKEKILNLGIKHLRDNDFTNTAFAERIKGLTTTEIKFAIVSAGWNTNLNDFSKLDELLDFYQNTIGVAGLSGIEGVNEPDNPIGTIGSDYPSLTRNWQQILQNKIRARSAFKDVKVIGPSCAFGDCYSAFGILSGLADVGNLHWYTGNNEFEHQDFNFFSWHLDQATTNNYTENEPIWVTETGSNTSTQGISESIAAKYLPRGLLWLLYEKNVDRVYKYELVDLSNDQNDVESNWGLLRNDGSEKPTYKALKNILSILSDNSSSFTASELNYTLEGNTENVYDILFQKSNGDFYLITWLGVESTSVTRNLTLSFNELVSKVQIYEPSDPNRINQGTEPIANFENLSSIQLEVPDHIQVIKITPARQNSITGTYKIKNLDYDGFLKGDNSDQVSLSFSDSDQEKWDVISLENNIYKLRNIANGKWLDSDSDGSVNLSSNEGSDKEWIFEKIAENTYALKNNKHLKYLDADIGNQVDLGSSVEMDNHWEFIPIDISKTSLDSKENLLVYPNPFFNNLNINTFGSSALPLQLRLYDISGRIVYQAIINSKTQNIKLGSEIKTEGTFFLELLNPSGEKKIIKIFKKSVLNQ